MATDETGAVLCVTSQRVTFCVANAWRAFLRHAHRDLDTTLYDVCCLGDSEAMVAESSALVLAETKVATASLEWEYADSRVPQSGDLSVVTDWCGRPLCALETTAAQVLPYPQGPGGLCRG